jgi:hypothetical protein
VTCQPPATQRPASLSARTWSPPGRANLKIAPRDGLPMQAQRRSPGPGPLLGSMLSVVGLVALGAALCHFTGTKLKRASNLRMGAGRLQPIVRHKSSPANRPGMLARPHARRDRAMRALASCRWGQQKRGRFDQTIYATGSMIVLHRSVNMSFAVVRRRSFFGCGRRETLKARCHESHPDHISRL